MDLAVAVVMRTLLGMAVALALSAACRPTAAPPPATGPAGKMENQMENCPSAVRGAVTNLRTVPGGVELDITAIEPRAAEEIVARARRDSVAGEPNPNVGEHTGAHGGPGTGGHCPVVHRSTIVTLLEIGGGVRLTVIAKDPAEAAALERETRKRLEWLYPAERAR